MLCIGIHRGYYSSCYVFEYIKVILFSAYPTNGYLKLKISEGEKKKSSILEIRSMVLFLSLSDHIDGSLITNVLYIIGPF